MVMVVVGDGRDVSFWRAMQQLGTSGQQQFGISAPVRIGARLQIVVVMVVMMKHVFLLHQAHDVGSAASLLRFPLSRLNAVFAHREWAIYAVQFKVQPTSVANRFAFVVATPKCRCSSAAIGAA